VCGDTGHTFRVHHLPVATDDAAFFGYPEHLWPELRRNLDAGQVDVQARLSVMHGNVFPNFTVLENFKTSTESKGSHTRYIRVTTQYPIAPGRTEMLWWVFVPNRTSVHGASNRSAPISGPTDCRDAADRRQRELRGVARRPHR